MTQSARFKLPYILPGQAQKELFHNEALAALDAALHAAVEEGAPRTDAPPAPVLGEAWIVAGSAAGEWSGKGQQIAVWSEAGWRFVAPVAGMLVWDKAARHWLHFDGAAWSGGELRAAAVVVGGQQVVGTRQPHVPSPSGGTIIDGEARAAIEAVIATLISHGLIE